MAEGVAVIVLAGGQSRRMGREKAHLPWGGTTLIEHVVETLRPVTEELIVAVSDARGFRHLNAAVVEDRVPDAHALGGLYTGLLAAAHDRSFVCACDAPFLNRRLIRLLCGISGEYDLIVPATPEGLQPLHAVYAKSAVRTIEEQLRARQWDLKALVPRVRALVIPTEAIRHVDPQGLSFFNINTPEDYARAREIQKGPARVGAAQEV